MFINEQAVVDQWSPLLEAKTGIKDSNKLKWLSVYCHNHKLAEGGNLNESFSYNAYQSLGSIPGVGSITPAAPARGPLSFYTGTTGSGDKFPSLLPLAIQVAAKTVGFDVVPVIPMNGPTGVLTYMDFVYGGGNLGTDRKPIMIKIDAADINSTKYVKGTKYWGISAVSANGTDFVASSKALEMLFIGYSYYDGEPIFRVGSTYNLTGSTTTKVEDTSITIAQVFDGGAYITTDATGPQVTVVGTTSDKTAVTASAELVKALEDHIVGPAGAGTYDTDTWNGPWTDPSIETQPMDRGTGETTYYRQMGMNVYTKFIAADTYQVAAGVTHEQIQDLGKQFGIDVLQKVETCLINEIAQNTNKHILSRISALGWSNNAEYYKTQGVTLNFTLDRSVLAAGTSPSYLNKLGYTETIPYNKYQDFGDFENMSTLQSRIKMKVLAASDIINQRGRRGNANFIITNIQIGAALQANAQYTFAPIDNKIKQDNPGMYPLGDIAGMTIYVDPNMRWDDTRIIVGRKGGDDEPGIKYCPYLLCDSIQTIAEATMSPKIALKTRYALVEAGFHPETMYYVIYMNLPSGTMII